MIINFEEQKKLPKKHKKLKTVLITFVILIALFIFLIIKTGYLSVAYDIFKITGNKIKRTKTETTIHYKYDNSNKFTNILLLGSDTDPKFAGQPVLTQTIMIISINPYQKKIYMISIPRDFWVKIPGVGYGKFDQASLTGGFGLTRQLVESYFGIKIDYYAWVGLSGFVKLINTFGGVNVVPTHPVLDWSYPNDITGNPKLLYNAINLYISGAPQYMTGSKALEYVRSRHGDLQGDFGRSKRQQQVLRIIKNKLDNVSTLSEIPSLFNNLSKIVKTDMSIPEVLSFAQTAIAMKNTPITSIVLSPPHYSSIPNYLIDGQDVVLPNWTKIHALFQKLYGN